MPPRVCPTVFPKPLAGLLLISNSPAFLLVDGGPFSLVNVIHQQGETMIGLKKYFLLGSGA